MPRQQVQPTLVPVLSPGRHRTPRTGACFMEFASYLAGERWSDHPRCTHGGLANLARMVNDCVTDDARNRLAPLIPSVIGLTTDDPRLDPTLAVVAACAALPIAAEERQRSLAIGVQVCQAHLARARSPIELDERIAAAFRSAPNAERWARGFIARNARRVPRDVTARHAYAIVQGAVDGISLACVRDSDERLVSLLTESIELSLRFIDAAAAQPLLTPDTAQTRFSRTKARESANA